MQDPTQTQPTQAPQESLPGLLVHDLAVIKRALELAAERGAFRAQEFHDIGTVFQKLEHFLNYVEQMATAENQPKGETND